MAIQGILNKELGLNLNENPWQGGYVVDIPTDPVEEAKNGVRLRWPLWSDPFGRISGCSERMSSGRTPQWLAQFDYRLVAELSFMQAQM